MVLPIYDTWRSVWVIQPAMCSRLMILILILMILRLMILIGQQPVTDSVVPSAAERLSPVSAPWPPTVCPSFLQREKIFLDLSEFWDFRLTKIFKEFLKTRVSAPLPLSALPAPREGGENAIMF